MAVNTIIPYQALESIRQPILVPNATKECWYMEQGVVVGPGRSEGVNGTFGRRFCQLALGTTKVHVTTINPETKGIRTMTMSTSEV